MNIIKAAKPDKAKLVEDILIQNARRGVFQGRVSISQVFKFNTYDIYLQLGEEELKDILERVNSQTAKKTTVKYDRRRAGLDSDSD